MTRSPRKALFAALAGAIGLATTGAIALLSPYAQAHDRATLEGFTALSHTRAAPLANSIAHLVDPSRYVLVGLAFVAIALFRGRPRLALAVPLIMLVAVASAELLKPLIDATRGGGDWLTSGSKVGDGSWPSGHATAAMTVALCGVLVSPPSLRAFAVALGTTLTVGVSYSILLLHWHFPSDVLGGLLLAGTCVALGVAALWWADARWPAHSARRAISRGVRHPFAPAAIVIVALACAIALFIERAQVAGAAEVAPASFTAAAIAIAAIAGAFAAILAFALRR